MYTDDGVADALPATHETFAMTQTHWFHIEAGQITEHWSNRDDLGMAGDDWIPPTPPTCQDGAGKAARRAP